MSIGIILILKWGWNEDLKNIIGNILKSLIINMNFEDLKFIIFLADIGDSVKLLSCH